MLVLMKTNSSSVMVSSFNCGFDSMSSQMINMSMKFYLLLMLFILFDVELLFMYSYMMCSSMDYIVVYLMTTMLMISYLYELNEGMLNWT